MYVITFYSFKGGVGRTLALVNVAVELAQQGKSVLLVDFDLEAPGLDAFKPLRPERSTPGIVEFVTDYLGTARAPDARQYVSSCSFLQRLPGKMWVMPSGVRDGTYSARLSCVDWQTLYTERDGYLLFEDLRAQWESHLKPDYVLIDSRTGHTDVAGICTRHLPDAVVLCFLPNEENLSGLEGIVQDIRREKQGPAPRQIELYFVPANIPQLDDEQNILSRRLQDAGRRLQFEDATGIVHRYDSLSLLDDAIFALERPNSRLAAEYRQLTKAVTGGNLQDRDVALRYLSGSDGGSHFRVRGGGSLDRILEHIRRLHSQDGEVLYSLSRIVSRMGRDQEARALRGQAEDLGFRNAETMLDAAYKLFADGDREGASRSLKEAIFYPVSDYFDLSRAAYLCLQIDVDLVDWIRESPALAKLEASEKESLCQELLSKREGLPVVERLIRSLSGEHLEPAGESYESPPTSLVLCLIGQQKFREAMSVFKGGRPDPSRTGMVEAFNYAMAEWGCTGDIPIDLFRRVVELASASEFRLKNPCQCFAVAAWAIGDGEAARRYLANAEELARADDSGAFSGWRYLQTSASEFREDLVEIRSMIDGAPVRPRIFTLRSAT